MASEDWRWLKWFVLVGAETGLVRRADPRRLSRVAGAGRCKAVEKLSHQRLLGGHARAALIAHIPVGKGQVGF
jgi:hypothetical protein